MLHIPPPLPGMALGLTLAAAASAALGFEIDEFKSGMSREQIKATLPSWRLDRIDDLSPETMVAYDLPEKNTNRTLRFFFCNDRLVSFEQTLKPGFKNYITITSNYLNSYGQPYRTLAGNNVVSNGEKSTLGVTWRVRNELVGLRYVIVNQGEELTVSYETPNNCWQIPRY